MIQGVRASRCVLVLESGTWAASSSAAEGSGGGCVVGISGAQCAMAGALVRHYGQPADDAELLWAWRRASARSPPVALRARVCTLQEAMAAHAHATTAEEDPPVQLMGTHAHHHYHHHPARKE
jgi:hypothetical protein